MEKEVAPLKRQHSRTTALNIISSLCSVASIAFCVHLSISTAHIKNRVVDLESGTGDHTFIHGTGYSMDDFNSLVQERVDELLSQRSYESFVKIRTARQTSPECNCPPGPPGKRGRRGRDGEPVCHELS
ncbi:collagen alpha-1(XXV) chain-like [Leuresthes tenuis]|uniref:collagen alpha-1(XXV) chain-like n=1 Tax=Leuresthes tenuis TaxID=355514 RepID=UPI003B505978